MNTHRYSVLSLPTALSVILISLVVISVCSISKSYAEMGASVRFYKLNSKQQHVRQNWVKNDDQPGCHDLKKARNVHRFAQVGFKQCSLFAEKECAAESLVKALWTGKKYRNANFDVSEYQANLLPGSNWVLAPETNTEVRSWSCELGDDG